MSVRVRVCVRDAELSMVLRLLQRGETDALEKTSGVLLIK